MKKLLLILLTVLFGTYSYSQCNEYYVLKKGTSWQISNFNAKGKLEGKTIQKVTEYKETANGFEATLEIISQDENGEQVIAGTTTLKCEGGTIYFDLENMLPTQTLKSIEGFEVTVNGNNLELPDDLKAGQALKDAEMTMLVEASPLKLNFIVNVTDRKVEAEEKLNVPAGSFDTYKITQNVYMKTMMKVESSSIEWYSKGVGMVKSESYNKKGKLMGYSLLTAYHE